MTRNELTDLVAVAEDEGGHPYALACLLGLNGLRVAEACGADITDLGGSRYQPTLYIHGKGDQPAEAVLNPRTQHAIDGAITGRVDGPLLRNEWGQQDAAAQRRSDRPSPRPQRRDHPPGHPARAAPLLHTSGIRAATLNLVPEALTGY